MKFGLPQSLTSSLISCILICLTDFSPYHITCLIQIEGMTPVVQLFCGGLMNSQYNAHKPKTISFEKANRIAIGLHSYFIYLLILYFKLVGYK